MSTSVVSSPIHSAGTGLGSPGFRSQRKMSAGTIMKKIQTLQDTIESLRQQLTFQAEEEGGVQKKPKKVVVKEQKEKKITVAAAEGAAAKQKKMQKTKEEEEKDKIPMPWTGQVDLTTCVGLKAQYGLFIQCGKACDSKSTSFQIDNHECRFCADCSKKCDENGKHPVGTIEERIEAGVGKYVNAKTGKKETMYIEALEKMGITKEQALESAAKRGFQIPDWMLEKAEKKRGRPAAVAKSTTEIETKTETEIKPKEKKPRQPRATKKTASVETHDTPQKKNSDSVQSSNSVDLNDDNTPIVAQEKKKRGRPAKSNTQNNVGESEMQKLIVQATTEKKKRLSVDPSEIVPSLSSSQEENVETCLQSDSDEGEKNQHAAQEDDDALFDMFNEIIEHQEQQQKQEKEQQQQKQEEPIAAAVVDVVIEKKEKVKKSKKNASEEKVEKVKTDKKKDKDSTAAAAAKKKAKEEEAAAKKKVKEEEEAAAAAAALKKAQEETMKKKQVQDEETEDEEGESNEEEEEELECEEYEYHGEIYGLAPNGDIYSQDGELVGTMKNGVPKML